MEEPVGLDTLEAAIAWRLVVVERDPLEEEEEEEEVVERSVRVVPLFFQVRGGPQTWMLLAEGPMVARECRTVPKSQASSRSPFTMLDRENR